MDILAEGKKQGIQAVLDEGHDPAMAVPGAITGEQAALFPVKMQDDGGAVAPVKKAGRPAGSKNRSTEEWRNFLFARFRSPLVGLAEIAGMDVVELAKVLRFESDTRRAKPEELLELVKVQIACRDKLAPYMHSKMPLAIQSEGGALINLNIGTAAGTTIQQVVEEVGGMIEIIENQSEENQCFSGDDFADSVVADSVVCDESEETSAFEDEKAADLESVEQDGGAS